MATKQVIVIRKDLKMRRGKEIAQGAHASMGFLTGQIAAALADGDYKHFGRRGGNGGYIQVTVSITPADAEWIESSFKKVCLQVESEEELLAVHEAALAAGLYSRVVRDSGATEFHGEPTITCLAIGPDSDERIDPVTGHLKLY